MTRKVDPISGAAEGVGFGGTLPTKGNNGELFVLSIPSPVLYVWSSTAAGWQPLASASPVPGAHWFFPPWDTGSSSGSVDPVNVSNRIALLYHHLPTTMTLDRVQFRTESTTATIHGIGLYDANLNVISKGTLATSAVGYNTMELNPKVDIVPGIEFHRVVRVTAIVDVDQR